jgi:hypothetical protein
VGDALIALGRGLLGAFHPRMLLLTLMALSAALMLWFLLVWQLVDPLLAWVHNWLMVDGQVPQAVTFVSDLLGPWVKTIIVPVIVFFIIWPLVASTAVIVASVTVMPFVISHVTRHYYPQLGRSGESGFFASAWQAIKASAIFVLGWILTLPLWLVPGVALVLPFIWTAYLLVAVMSFDCLIEHASREEFKHLYRTHSGGAWLLGLACAVLSVLPPLFILVPVISALAFTHYYLGLLVRLRESNKTWQHESV